MTTPPPSAIDDREPRSWPAWVASGLTVLVFAAGEPIVTGAPMFGAGYVLRRVALGLALGILLLLAVWIPSRLGRPRGKTALWLLAPLGIVALGLLTQSGAGPRNAIRHGIVWIALGLLPFALANAFEIPKAARRTWVLVLGVAGLYCIFAFYELQGGGRMAASFGRPAVAGSVFGALIGPALLLIRPRWIGGGLALLLATTCAMSGSRAALVGAAFGVLVAFAVSLADPINRKRARRVIPWLAAVLLVWFGLGVNDATPLPGGKATVQVRMGLYRAAGALIAERPLTGHGLGRYRPEVMRVRDVHEARLEPGRRPEHAHLDLLHVSTEGGVLAGLLLLAWLGGAFVLGAHRATGGEPVRRGHVAAALSVLTALGIAGLADGVMIDPGPGLLASLAVASLLTMSPRRDEAHALPAVVRGLALLAGMGLLGAAYGLRLDAAADYNLQQYVNARVGARIDALAGKEVPEPPAHLLEAARRYREDFAEVHHQYGLLKAESNNLVDARAAFRRAFEIDPGKTESRLDLSRTFELDERFDDAKAALLEASRRDPTRFDVWMRLGHLEIGPEPIPGDAPPGDTDWVAALKRYNTAHDQAPNRFEYEVALARMDRRKAKGAEDLKGVDLRLEKAAEPFAENAASPLEKLAAAPAELIVEAFRVSEAMGAGEAFPNAVLRLALKKDPDVGIAMRREVDRFLTEAQRREDAAKEQAAATLDPTVFAAADRAFDAATIRLAALLQEGQLDLVQELEQARMEKELKRYRMSLVRYRGILAATQGPSPADIMGGDRNAGLRWRSDLLREAAVVATKVNAEKARAYWAQAFTLSGMLHLNEADLGRALTMLRRALDYDDAFGDAHFQLARVFAQRGELDDASASLLRAFELAPRWKQPAMVEPDFVALRQRPEIRRALK